ncbi:MAG: hypothetical protein K9J30_04700 [Bacteroidales bacterium]|nr:hypothetical protein [Bacteroidales bacterium]
MGLDIKIPIGAMFLLLGIILTIFGLATLHDEMYSISIGKNINLISGIGMVIFGSFMLLVSDLVRKKKLVDEDALKDDVLKKDD